MTATVEDDFRDFVAARWSDLESVVRVVVLDPALARTTTTDSLARLHQRWGETVEAGRPADAARSAVLTAAVGAVGVARHGDPPASGVPLPEAWDGGSDAATDPVVEALVAAVRAAPVMERAVLAAATLWDATPGEVARLLGTGTSTVDEHAASLRQRLEATHDGARAAQGLGPSPWERDHAVAAAVDELLRGLGDPPDPAALVAERSRGLRRRTVVAGGVAVLALGAVGTGVAVARRQPNAPVAGPAAPRPMTSDDPRWASSARWPARGPLADDPAVRALLGRRAPAGDHVLWAGDVGVRRVVVVRTQLGGDTLGAGTFGGTAVRVFAGAAGSDPVGLDAVELSYPVMPDTADVVVLSLPDGNGADAPRSVLIVLARPTERSASVSVVVRPTPAGGVQRSWSDLTLDAGIGTTVLEGPVPTALRMRVGGWEGSALTPGSAYGLFDPGPRSTVPLDWPAAMVSSLTGIPGERLRTTVTADAPVPSGLLDDLATAPSTQSARLVVVRIRTPDGAVVRTSAYLDRRQVIALEQVVVVAARAADDPFALQVRDLRADVAQFLVVAPGADRVQVISTSPDGYPVSEAQRTGGRDVVLVPVVNGGRGAGFRIVTRDRRGKVVFDGVPDLPRFLGDG